MSISSSDLVALVLGDLDVATAAARTGLSEAEVRRCQAAYAEGLRAAASASRSPRRVRRPLAMALVLLGAGAAFAALTTMKANEPAIASQVNANFAYLEGLVLGFPDGGVSLAKLGAISSASLAASGAVTANSVTAGALSTAGTLTASGDVNLGAAGKTVSITGTVQALGAPVALVPGTTYTASTDGFVQAVLTGNSLNSCTVAEGVGVAGGGVRAQASVNNGCAGVDYPQQKGGFTMPVRKGETYSVTMSGTGALFAATFIPLGR